MKKALKINEKDNVVVVVEEINKDDVISYDNLDGNTKTVTAIENIPIYHKIAIVPIRSGDNVIKYGEHIGVASKDIEVGSHVHIKNVLNKREDLKLKEWWW